MNALFVALLIIGTTASGVALGVFSAYCAVTGLLAALNPSRPPAPLRALMPSEGSASGD